MKLEFLTVSDLQKVEIFFCYILSAVAHIQTRFAEIWCPLSRGTAKRRRQRPPTVRCSRGRAGSTAAGVLSWTHCCLDNFSPSVIRTNPLDWIVDIREHDMPHHVRTSIDKELFVGSWY